MSKAAEHAVQWVNRAIPELGWGELEPQDVITNVMHWVDANRQIWANEGVDNVAHFIVHQAQYHYEAEVGAGDDIANDPYYEEAT